MTRLILRYGALGLTLALAGGLLVACGDDDGGSNNVNQNLQNNNNGNENGNDNQNNNNNNNTTEYGCAEACTDMVAAGCDEGPTTVPECEGYCDAGVVGCPTEFAALLDCMSVDAVVTCDASGYLVFGGCETENAAIEACMSQPPDICETVCPDVVAEGCEHGPPDLSACVSGCAQTVAACPDEFQAVQDCAGADPVYECNAIGSPYPQGCGAEDEALMMCLYNVPQACIDECPAVVAADCTAGPPDLEECWSGCAEMFQTCETEFDAWITCGGAEPAFACDGDGRIIITGCDTENAALYTCIDGQ